MIDLSGKHILVTGATSPIGKAICLYADKLGAKLTMLGRSMEKLSVVEKELKGVGHKSFNFDITSDEEVLNFVLGSQSFDGIVYNAGLIDYTPIRSITAKKLTTVFNVNFNATVSLNTTLLKNKKLNKKASLVFISSISAGLGVPATALYASSKAALATYARVVASEVALQGIRANVISPGIISANSVESALTEVVNLKEQEKQYPLGYGRPADVADLAVFLLSERSRWITGTNINIDGGYTLS